MEERAKKKQQWTNRGESGDDNNMMSTEFA